MVTDEKERAARIVLVQQRYPQPPHTLRSGRVVDLRLMNVRDYVQFHAFAKRLPRHDLLYEQQDITDTRVLDEWMRGIRRGQAATVLAYLGDTVLGEASLAHSQTEWTRHTGEIRIIVAPEARGEGLGKVLGDEIFAIAEILGLERLTAQMLSDQRVARTVFERLGFKEIATLPRAAMDRDRKKHDILVMARDL